MPIPTESPQAQELKRELTIRANDRILVHNPTNEDVEVVWDGLVFEIPSVKRDEGFGKGNATYPRYIAMKYVKELTDRLLTERADAHIKKINDKRRERGQPALTPEERLKEETPYSINNKEARRGYYKQMWKGVFERYGERDIQRQRREPSKDISDEQLLEEIEAEVGEAQIKATAVKTGRDTSEQLEQLKEKQLKEIST